MPLGVVGNDGLAGYGAVCLSSLEEEMILGFGGLWWCIGCIAIVDGCTCDIAIVLALDVGVGWWWKKHWMAVGTVVGGVIGGSEENQRRTKIANFMVYEISQHRIHFRCFHCIIHTMITTISPPTTILHWIV